MVNSKMSFLNNNIPRLFSFRFAQTFSGLFVLALCVLPLTTGYAQELPKDTIHLSLEEALQVALTRNYELRGRQLDVENANSQVREAWGQVMPQVNLSSSYQRNVKTSNPFAGSSAGSLFSSFGYIDWLKFNEEARIDNDPSTQPISLRTFNRRRMQGYNQAGLQPGGGGNPFGVDNQFLGGISISQPLYNNQAFSAIAGAQQLKEVNQQGLKRTRQQVIHDVRATYYDVLLAAERVQVMEESLQRVKRTVEEASKRVQQGTASKYQRLSAQVQESNLETQLIELKNQADAVKDGFKHLLGLPISQTVELRDTLALEGLSATDTQTVHQVLPEALDQRPDLQQARLAVELQKVQKNITEGTFFPAVDFFASLDYSGRVPDDRTRVLTDPNDPFSFSADHRRFFSRAYWNPSVAVGLRLNWTIFDGFQRSSQLQQAAVAVNRAQLQQEQLREAVRLEVEQALQNLQAARQRIKSQQQNLSRAELNYEYAVTRLNEGVGSPLEEREASEQLDQSRLNYLQAVRDYLVAKSTYALAAGTIDAGVSTRPFNRR